MECTLSGNGIKGLHRAVTCLSRIGPELLIEALPDKMVLRSLNSSRSAFLALTFKRQYFDRFQLSLPTAQCSVLLKAVCTVLRTQPSSMERLSITLSDKDATKLQWSIDCYNGLRKTYWISCNHDVEMQHVAIERSSFSSYLVARPRDFNRLLSNFQSNLQEITLIATEPFHTPTDSETTPEGKAVELRSYIDPVKETTDGALHTQLWIDPAEELRDYRHNGIAVDVTFSVKELKAFMAFCEGSETDMHLFFDKAGSPILLAPKFSLDDATNADFDATLVLATMLGSQLRSSESAEQVPEQLVPPKPAEQKKAAQAHSTPKTPAHVSDRTPTGSGPRSDHTAIWSELSGTGEQTSHINRITGLRQMNLQDSGDATEEIPVHGQRQEAAGRQPSITLDKHPVQQGNAASSNEDDNDVVIQPMTYKAETKASNLDQQLFGRDLSNWVNADSDDESGGDGFCVQSTPPHRRVN